MGAMQVQNLPVPRSRWAVVLAGALLALAALGALVYWRTPAKAGARIVAVADGDTLTAVIDGQRVKVRLWGIDAPESSQKRGPDSKAGLIELVLDRDVAVEDRGADKYGRRLAVLWVNGQSVNLAMVQAGWAWWYRRYAPRARDIEAAERSAREAHVGVWRDENAEAPWEFRRRGRGD